MASYICSLACTFLMHLQFFTSSQILSFLISAVFLLLSIITFHLNKKDNSLFLLFCGSLGLGLFIAKLDPFLNIWDEQYHALVAKHLVIHPFKPTLFEENPLEYNFKSWIGNHVWLHKPPLFLWQIAISLKLWGINELAVRTPSILLHAATSLIIYRIGKITVNTSVGFYGALFFSVAYYPLELISGRFQTDHNDIAFLFYVISSFWTWLEYQVTKKTSWLILIGLFSGLAVLTKWLFGLLIYPVWLISSSLDKKDFRFKWSDYLPLIIAFTITCLLFVPWQIYIFNCFPAEAQYETQLNAAHFFHPIEGHEGNLLFHFKALKDLYGSGILIPYLLLFGLIILIKKNINNIFRYAIITTILITYGFYSLAATKMTSFCLVVMPFAFLGLGALLDSGITFISKRFVLKKSGTPIRIIVSILICILLLKLSKIETNHTEKDPQNNGKRNLEIKQITVIKNQLLDLNDNKKWIVFNADIRLNGHISVMFYTNHIAFDFIPTQNQIDKVKRQSYNIAILDQGGLPDFILQDNSIIKIKLAPNSY